MNNKNKNWVYECLVDNDRDPVGLIAYALYKKSKHDIAVDARKAGKSEPEIQELVKTHHQSVLRSKHLLENFNTQATLLLKEIYDTIRADVQENLNKVHDRKVADLEREHDKKVRDLEREQRQAFNSAAQKLKNAAREYNSPTRLQRVLKWFWDGFSGVFAAVITALLIGGIIYHMTPDAQKAQSKQEAIRVVLDTLLGES